MSALLCQPIKCTGLLAGNANKMNYERITYHQILTLAAESKTQIIPWANCKLEERKGGGASMNVFSGTYRIDEKQYEVAFKLLKNRLSAKTQEWKRNKVLMDIRQELRIMGRLKGHSQIVQLLGISFIDHNPALILELADSNLSEYLEDENPNWDTKLLFASNIAVAVGTIHNAGIVHGDLKGENILVCKTDGHVLAKVSDFGFSATDLSVQQGRGPGATEIFAAPEYFEESSRDLNNKMDIYSYGLLVWQIAMDGKIPFGNKTTEEIYDMKRNETALQLLKEQLPEDTPEQIKKIIERTVVKDPSKRASIKDILEILNSTEDCQEEAKRILDSWTKGASQGPKGTIWVSELKKLKIPDSLKKSIFTEYGNLANQGDMVAMSRLGSCWQFGLGTERNIEEAFECFKKAAEGFLPAQTELAFCYSRGEGTKKDLVKAFELFMNAAIKANDPLAQFNVGACYEHGRGVSKNQEKAIEFYEKAVEADIPQAQYNLGICYIEGKGVIKDTEKAVELFTKAAEADYPEAQCYLAYCYERGLGVSQDYSKSAELYEKAAISGNATAQCNLGNMYLKGIGLPQDLKKAREYFEKAAEQEYLDAKWRLDYLDIEFVQAS